MINTGFQGYAVLLDNPSKLYKPAVHVVHIMAGDRGQEAGCVNLNDDEDDDDDGNNKHRSWGTGGLAGPSHSTTKNFLCIFATVTHHGWGQWARSNKTS